MLLAVSRPRKPAPPQGPAKVPSSKAQGVAGASQVVPTGAPARSRTKTDQDAFYLQVTRAQGDVIRSKADREHKSIKDVLLEGLMDRGELEADVALLRRERDEAKEDFRKCMEAATARMRDVHAMLLGASTERALTKEEAQIAMMANKFLSE